MADIEKRMKLAGKIACIAAVVFALPHFWMGVGIPFGFPGDPADLQNVSDPGVFWFVGGFALVAAVYAIGFTHSFRWMPRFIDSLRWRLPTWLVTLPAWVGGISFTLWGLGYFGLQLQFAMGVAQPTAQQADPNAILGYYWYSLFILWGVSLGLAAYYFLKVKNARFQTNQQ
jgi:hypothetical protein